MIPPLTSWVAQWESALLELGMSRVPGLALSFLFLQGRPVCERTACHDEDAVQCPDGPSSVGPCKRTAGL